MEAEQMEEDKATDVRAFCNQTQHLKWHVQAGYKTHTGLWNWFLSKSFIKIHLKPSTVKAVKIRWVKKKNGLRRKIDPYLIHSHKWTFLCFLSLFCCILILILLFVYISVHELLPQPYSNRHYITVCKIKQILHIFILCLQQEAGLISTCPRPFQPVALMFTLTSPV